MNDNKVNKKALTIYLVGIVLLTLVDQITKVLAVQGLKNQKPFVVIPGVFELFYLENKGAAWGMMSGARIFFLILTIVIVGLITWLMIRIPSEKRYIPMQVIAILIGAGAIGNFIDRLFLGYVRDFFYFSLINFPVFNVADCYVTVAMVLFVIFILFVYKEEDYTFLRRKK